MRARLLWYLARVHPPTLDDMARVTMLSMCGRANAGGCREGGWSEVEVLDLCHDSFKNV